MEIYYLWLAFHAGISLSIQHALLYQYGDPQTLYTASRQELSSQLKRLKSNTLMLSYDLKPANTLLQNHAHLGIKTLTCMDSRYRIKHPDYTAKKAASRIFPLQPIVLFYKGKLQPLTVPVVGVIGSRQTTHYGREAVQRVCRDYGSRDWIIASGLSAGIDAAAHSAALRDGNVTYAFLPHGLDRCYPADRIELMNKIAGNGCLISSYPAGYSPRKYHYIKRNELLCNWVDTLIIIEAKQLGGTLSTASYARKISKPIYAVPRNLFSPDAYGVNQLFRDGALPYIPENCDPIHISANESIHNKNIGLCKELDNRPLIQKLQKTPLSTCDLAAVFHTTLPEMEEQVAELELDAILFYRGDGKWHYTGDT